MARLDSIPGQARTTWKTTAAPRSKPTIAEMS